MQRKVQQPKNITEPLNLYARNTRKSWKYVSLCADDDDDDSDDYDDDNCCLLLLLLLLLYCYYN